MNEFIWILLVWLGTAANELPFIQDTVATESECIFAMGLAAKTLMTKRGADIQTFPAKLYSDGGDGGFAGWETVLVTGPKPEDRVTIRCMRKEKPNSPAVDRSLPLLRSDI